MGQRVAQGLRIATHLAALALVGLVLASAGQPLFAEDSWWHLSMGAAYATNGPWLDADPLLHTATGPPAPAAWLFDVALDGVARIGGFHALRVVHVALVAAILGLAFAMLRRASGSAGFASLGVCVFATLAAYRLFQLRPHLATMLATLLVLWLLLLRERVPTRRSIALAALVFGLWANLHGAFLVGLGLLGAAAVGEGAAWGLGRAAPGVGARRALALVLALALGAAPTLANPSGIEQHLLWFRAGDETPELGLVADEWAPFDLLAWPAPRVPPTPASWVMVWAVLLALAGALLLRVRAGRAAARAPGDRIDPALLAATAAATLATLSAVRLAWLVVVPLLLLGSLLAPRLARTRAHPGVAAAAVLAVPAFVLAGPWPLVSAGVHRAHYHLPYPVSKVDLHPVWFLRDAGLEGRLFNGYETGNFLGYWLAPRLRVFVNGSLNVPPDVMRTLQRIEQTAAAAELTPLLDRHGVDVFVGMGAPLASVPGRPRHPTTRLLASDPDWTLVFRNATSAVYLRDHPRNRENLARVAAYYAKARVPFDPDRGFDPERVIRRAPAWAATHGLVPVDFPLIQDAAAALGPDRRRPALERLARTHALLGLYERAIAVDRRRLREQDDALQARRRLVFSLLHLDRIDDARRAADALAGIAHEHDGLSRRLVDAARSAGDLPEPVRRAAVARLPLVPRAASQHVLGAYLAGEARASRHFGGDRPDRAGNEVVR